MANAGRRGHFSLILWPSLYSLKTILLIPLAFALIGTVAVLLLQLSRQNERQLTSRASERVQAIIALKLSGAESWQWKREIACQNSRADCLRVRLSFSATSQSSVYTEKTAILAPCKICHGQESQTGGFFYATFDDIRVSAAIPITQWVVFCMCLALGIGNVIFLFLLRRRRRTTGICIASFEHDALADAPVKNFLKRVATSRRLSYYSDMKDCRVRIATTPESFAQLLRKHGDFLEQYRGSLRFAALHIDPASGSLLPIEMLKAVYAFLSKTPARTYLLHERLAAHIGVNDEKGRRLVFKNKSGALLKFVAWEAEKDKTRITGAE